MNKDTETTKPADVAGRIDGLVMSVDDLEAGPESYKWNIEPHPYSKDYDIFVTNDDKETLDALLHAAEMYLWDDCEPGQERTLKVRHNK